MFAYCLNNPVIFLDNTGNIVREANPNSFSALEDTYGGSGGGIVLPVPGILKIAEEVAEKVKSWASSVLSTSTQKGHYVYILVDPNDNYLVKYVGRTTDPARRMGEHQRDLRHPERKYYNMNVVASGLTKETAILLEQVLISAYTMEYLENARREIAVINVGKYSPYMGAVAEIINGATEDGLLNLVRE